MCLLLAIGYSYILDQFIDPINTQIVNVFIDASPSVSIFVVDVFIPIPTRKKILHIPFNVVLCGSMKYFKYRTGVGG